MLRNFGPVLQHLCRCQCDQIPSEELALVVWWLARSPSSKKVCCWSLGSGLFCVVCMLSQCKPEFSLVPSQRSQRCQSSHSFHSSQSSQSSQRPEIPELPELPDIPEIPEFSELPKIPELSELPGFPELPEFPVDKKGSVDPQVTLMSSFRCVKWRFL